MNSRPFLFLKKSRSSSFFVYSDVNLVTLVLFVNLSDTLVVFRKIYKRIYGARPLSVYWLLSGLVPRYQARKQ